MAIEITIPRLGWNMEEGRFVAWLKRDGDAVRAGEPLFSLESEKSVEEVESLDAGTLRIPPDGPTEGDVLKVGTVIGYLTEPGEPMPTPRISPPAAVEAAPPPPHPNPPPQGGREPSGRIAVTPRAKRVAKELGIEWSRLRGTGRNGRIRERDVQAAVSPAAGDRAVPVTPTRRAIAERMTASLRTTAPVTLTTLADATNLVGLRERLRAAGGVVPTYTDLIVKLTAAALLKHPMLNARWEGERIALPAGVHVGIAVDTDAGLLVPVIRDVPALGLRQLAARSRELIDRARTRRLTAGEMSGGTFTVTNLGAFGIDAFTPIINPPQCAVLGVGRIRREPAVVGDQIVPRDRVTLSLTFDHRVVDGAPAARFLADLRGGVEDPDPSLLT